MDRTPDNTPIANASDHAFNRDTMPLYLFSFGAYGSTHVYAWGCHTMADAMEAACEWLKDNAPGHFVTFSDADYDEAARDIGAPADWREDDEWASKVWERAEVDHTSTESGYLASWEWGAVEIRDADEIAHIQWRSREGNDADEGDYCVGQYRYAFDPDQGPEDCQGSEA